MILTICPNPSIDCTIEVGNLVVGKLNRIDSKMENYSGKALNVAIGVARFGEQCTATGFMFENHAKLFEQRLFDSGVNFDFVYASGSARTNYKIIDKKAMLTEINDIGESVAREEQLELIEKVAELSKNVEICVLSGSLPKDVNAEYYGELLEKVPQNVKVIIDAEKDNIIAALKKRSVFMVKPSISELEMFTGEKITNLADILQASKKYLDMGVEHVLISMGAEGAVFTDGYTSFYCKSASVAVNSTVGAGDSMIAAVCVALKRGVSDAELTKMAVSAGTAAVTTSGTNLFYKDSYVDVYSKVNVQKI